MKTLNKILRFRFPDDIIQALSKITRASEYVRLAVREKLERDGFLKEETLPF